MKSLDTPNFKINSSLDSPIDIDYDILGFHKKRYINKGLLNKVEYYRDFIVSSTTYSDLIVVEKREYNINSIGLVTHRNLTINWLLDDETTGATKTTIKYYSPIEAIDEGIVRRKNLIGDAKVTTIGLLVVEYGENTGLAYCFDFMNSIKPAIDIFIDGYTQPLRDAISGSTKGYITTQMKEIIIPTLSLI